MSDHAALMAKLDAIHAEVAALRVNSTAAKPNFEDALTVDAFLGELKAGGVVRGRDWLYDQIRLQRRFKDRGVRTLAVGKPYRIPRSELQRIFAQEHGSN